MERELPLRKDVNIELTWDLSDIYRDTQEFEDDMKKALALSQAFEAREGKAAADAASLLESMDLLEAITMKEEKFLSYASMLQDQDTSDSQSQSLKKKSERTADIISKQTAFFTPEMLKLTQEQIVHFYEEEPRLKKYEVTIREVLRQKEHSLSTEMEKVAASAQDMARVPSSAFGMLADADMTFPSVVLDDGSEVTITNGRFVPLETISSRPVRKEIFEKYYQEYAKYADVWAVLYEGQVKQQIFFSDLRGYGSTFEAAVDQNNVSPAVCDNLFKAVHENMDKMYRYVGLRKKLLGVDELHMYDVYTPIVKDVTWKVTFDEAKEIALKALAPLGTDYTDLLQKAFDSRWIDVVENRGKRGGAYSTDGIYGVHPYVLLNFNGTLDDIFTLVHEMGHALHTWYSCADQTFFNSQYRIFVAEVASTTNEVLLLEYLLSSVTDREKLKYLVNHYLESFKGTLYRQTMFEEFERKTNSMAENGEPLVAKNLSDVYYELNKEYFGPEMVSDDLIRYEWCRIPHFYYNFYVYQYATSFSAAVAIAHRILSGERDAVKNYKKFLSAGCTQDPVSILKIAGVDMSTAQPVSDALEVFGQQLDRMEQLMKDE